MKFKVGDLIVGNSLAVRHSSTVPGWKGRVISTFGNNRFVALGIEGCRLGPYSLNDDAFDLIDQRTPLKAPSAHRNGRPAMVEKTDDPERPFAAIVAGHRLTFDKFGNFYPLLECPVDLVQV